jgi:hypothetical protein
VRRKPFCVAFLALLSLGLLPSCRARRTLVPGDQSREILLGLEPQIRAGGEATVVFPSPDRSYRTPASNAAQQQLGAVLDLPALPPNTLLPSCRWAPVDASAIGMGIALTEFSVVGDSALVSVLRTCRQRMRGREMRFEGEPTWILHRSGGRWSVVRTLLRVTDARRDHRDPLSNVALYCPRSCLRSASIPPSFLWT